VRVKITDRQQSVVHLTEAATIASATTVVQIRVARVKRGRNQRRRSSMLRVVAVVVTVLALCCSCRSKGYVDMQPVDIRSWQTPVSIIYENSDTVSLKSISVALRYNDNFTSDTLSVYIQTSLPDAHQARERVVLNLQRGYRATQLTASESIGYREKCLLDQRGSYIFTITPCREVCGIEAVGVEIVE
jgi:hypothetical protein